MRFNLKASPGIRRMSVAGLAAAALVSITALPANAAKGHAAATDQMTVIAFPISTSLMLPYVAQDFGFFKKYGANVKIMTLNAGSAAVELPLVLNGSATFGVSGTGDVLPTIAGGAPITLISGPGTQVDSKTKTSVNVVIAKNPAIKTIKDLAGKTIGLNSLGTQHQLFLSMQMRKAGGDPNSMKFVKVPLSNIGSAIANGQIDAGQAQEPALTQDLGQGMHRVVGIGVDVTGGLPQGIYWGARSWVKAHSADVLAFQKAMGAAARALVKDPNKMKKMLTRYSAFPADIISSLQNIGQFTDSNTQPNIIRLGKVLHRYGLLKPLPLPQTYIWSPKK